MLNLELERRFPYEFMLDAEHAQAIGFTYRQIVLIEFIFITGGELGDNFNDRVAKHYNITVNTLKRHIQNICIKTEAALKTDPTAYNKLCDWYKQLESLTPSPEFPLSNPLMRPAGVDQMLPALIALRVINLEPTN